MEELEIQYRIKQNPEKDIKKEIEATNVSVKELGSSVTPTIDGCFVGRDKELNTLACRMVCRYKANVLIVGNSGSGKTTLVENFAYYVKLHCNPLIGSMRLFEVHAASILAGTAYRGDFEKKLLDLVLIFENNPNAILFIDEAHMLAMTKDAHGGIDGLNILKQSLSSKKLKCILATTPDELMKFQDDPAFMRRFSILNLENLSFDEKCKALLLYFNNFVKETSVRVKDKKRLEEYFMNELETKPLDNLIDSIDYSISNALLNNKGCLDLSCATIT